MSPKPTTRANEEHPCNTWFENDDQKFTDGEDVLDEREMQQRKSLIGTALMDEQNRPETQCTTEESARFMSDFMRAVK